MGSSKIMISVPEEILREIDNEARQEHRSRSEFIREAVRLFLEVKKSKTIPGRISRIQTAVALQDSLAGLDSVPNWNGTEEIRKWRESRWKK